MAKPKNKKKAKKVIKKQNSPEITHLEVLKKYCLRNVDGSNEALDSLFAKQANRIQEQIKILKEKQ